MKKFTRLFPFFLLLFGFQQQANAQCQVTTVSTPDGANTAYTCPGDGNADVVMFANTNTSGSSYAYAITDNNYMVLAIEPNDFHDFDNAPPGNCFVWGFSYTGNVTAQPGGSVFSLQFSDACWNISQNAISVIRDMPDGGMVATPQGDTQVFACLDDGIPDVVGFTNNGTSNSNYTYVVTDPQGNILGLPGTSFLDFSGAGVGTCRVWGLSYTGHLTAMMGMNINTAAVADNCFDFSDNYIEVVRNAVDGGAVMMPNGLTYRSICTMDGNPDVVMFTNTSTSSASYAYAITNSSNVVLAIETNDFHDFDDAPTGTCRVWGFSYTGDISAQPGESVFAAQFSTGCFEISSTAISVQRTAVDGGTVAMPSGATTRYTCPGDGNADVVMFTNTSTTNTSYAYVITDDQNNILGLPPGNSQDFEGAGVATCRVWGLAYTGNITAQMGDNIDMVDLSDGCFGFSSNFISIVRDNPDGGTVQTTDGETNLSLCVGDGIDDIFSFEHVTSSMSAYGYLITDDQNNLLGHPPGNSQNFEGAGTGTCRVWGLSYTGMVTVEAGDNIMMVSLSNDCFELSSNFIEVNRTGVDGGTVAMPSGATTRYTCPGDGNADVVMFTNTSTSNTSYAYVITDDQNNILGLPPGDSQDFEGAGIATCRVWGLAYTGNITAQMGDNIDMVDLSDGCFGFSSNFITINRDVPDGGTVATDGGETSVSVTVGDGIADVVTFMHMDNSNSNYTYIVTDDQNNILGLPPGNSQDFDGAPAGTCRIWGLAYSGMVTAEVGDNIDVVDLTNDCYNLSDNFIEVVRTSANPNLTNDDIIVALSPNPTPNMLFIDVKMEEKQVAEPTVISVYSLSGRLVYTKEFLTSEGANRFDVSLGHLQEGLYKVAVQNGRSFKNLSFVKE